MEGNKGNDVLKEAIEKKIISIDPHFHPSPTKRVRFRKSRGQIAVVQLNRATRRKLGIR